MKIITVLLSSIVVLLSSTAFAEPINYQRDIYPIMIRNCAGCHNANTPGRNWLDQGEATKAKSVMYYRVFQKGDMPLWFRFFGGEDKELLRRWLEMPELKAAD